MKLSLPNARYRRFAGLVLGALLGLAYGLTSQVLNRVLLPGVPLYQPLFGPIGNMTLAVLIGAALGVICAWPQSGVLGAFVASAVCAIAIIGGSLATAKPSGTSLGTAMTGLFLTLPFWGMLLPLLAALRWGVTRLEEAERERQPFNRRASGPLLLILAAGLVGALTLYSGSVRTALRHTHALLQEGQQAATQAALPAPLAAPQAGPFYERGRSVAYTLAPETQNPNRFRIARPARNFGSHRFVVARFANGWGLVCVYITLDEPPLCQGFDQLPP